MPQPPDLKIPQSTTTVSVRIIDTTTKIDGIPLEPFVSPQIKGFTQLECCAFSFLIEHASGRKLLFDLGVRKDWENMAPRVVKRIKDGGWTVSVDKGVRQILEEHGVNAGEIEGIVWSHWHWDHTGDVSSFEKSTALIVGPGFKKNFTPGYPTSKDAPILEADYEGRELREVSFEGSSAFKIGNFNAVDYFSDGSLYLLDSPGHAVGHICALARVTTSPDTFIFMGGDACHHSGEFRPSQWLPLPSSISPNPLHLDSSTPCPGAMFEHLLRDGDETKPFYEIARREDGSGVADDVDEADRTVHKVMEADAQEEILVVMAHDKTLLPVLDFFPKYANDFAKKGWVKDGRWAFLSDFRHAIKE